MLISEAIEKVKTYCNGTNPDGTPIVMDRDLAGEARGTSPVPGPVERFTGEIVFG